MEAFGRLWRRLSGGVCGRGAVWLWEDGPALWTLEAILEPNTTLQQLRIALPSKALPGHPLSRQELADRVNVWVWDQSGKRVELDANYIGKLERGTIRWPQADYRAALRAVLSVSDDAALGFWPPRRGSIAASDWGKASAERTTHVLRRLGAYISAPLPYRAPLDIDALAERLIAPATGAIVITGAAGTGKTRLARSLAHRLTSAGQVACQLHSASAWDSEQLDLAREILHYDSHDAEGDTVIALEHATSGGTGATVIVIDGIDHQRQLHHIARQVDALLRQVLNDQVRFVLLIRTPPAVDLSAFPILHSSCQQANDRTGIELRPWNESAAREAWRSCGPSLPPWELLPAAVRTLAQVPLLMHLIVAARVDPGGAHNTYTLLEHCIAALTGSAAEQPGVDLRHVHPALDHDVVDEFADARSLLERLRDEMSPAATADTLNTMAGAAREDGTTLGRLGLVVAGLQAHAPSLLTAAALAPVLDRDTTLPLLLDTAATNQVELNPEVIRHAAAYAQRGLRLDLTLSILGYPGAWTALHDDWAPWLAAAIRHHGPAVWEPVAVGLAEHADADLIDRLVTSFDLDDPRHAVFAARHLILAATHGTKLVSRLRSHPDWRVRAGLGEIIASLAKSDQTAALALAEQLALDTDYKVRLQVACALPVLPYHETKALAEAILDDDNWHVRSSLVRALAEAQPKAARQLTDAVLAATETPAWQRCPPDPARQVMRLRLALGSVSAEAASTPLYERVLVAHLRAIHSGTHRPSATEWRHLQERAANSASPIPQALIAAIIEPTPLDSRSTKPGFRRLRGGRALQVALDTTDLAHATAVAVAAAEAGADCIEIGDPLIKAHGIGAISEIKRLLPHHTVIAEMMSADWGRDQIEIAVESGADAVLLIGPASSASIQSAARTAARYGVPVLLDLPPSLDWGPLVKTAEAVGIDGFTITANIDTGIATRSRTVDAAAQVRRLTRLPIAISGGFATTDLDALTDPNWDLLIVGRAITDATDPGAVTRRFADLIKQAIPADRGGQRRSR